MTSPYDLVQEWLRVQPRRWLVTGAAGFIGSHLVEHLLRLDQTVVGLDNFATGRRENLADVAGKVTKNQWGRFRLIEGDIGRMEDCRTACTGDVNYILHQAALGSVPRSVADPLRSHTVNVDGCLHMLLAAREARIERLVYASSSSVYGDHAVLPKVEANIGRPLSPYAATKLIDEIYAGVFFRTYGLPTVGLRYFNVFGPRQDPEGAYAAVIPKWFAALLKDETVKIHGDGLTSRDFCYVENVVQANILAACAPSEAVAGAVFNIACGATTTLLDLFAQIRALVMPIRPEAARSEPVFGPERAGDVRHSFANIDAARTHLGYLPSISLAQGLDHAAAWYAGAHR